MTAVEERPRIERPGSSVVINPQNLMNLRLQRNFKPGELASAIAGLGLVNDRGRPVTPQQDFLRKLETGARKPSLDTLRAICAVLECEPRDLMPGAPEIEMPEAAKVTRARLAHNQDLIAFAKRYKLRYKGRRTYYGTRLEAAFQAYVGLKLAEAAGDESAVAAAQKAFDEALDAAPKAEYGDAGELAQAS